VPSIDNAAAPARRGLAVFDLDGTLTYGDTLLAFLLLALRARPARLLGAWRLPGLALRYLVDRDRGRLKGALVAALLADATRDDVAGLAVALVARLKVHELRAGALAAVDAHRRAGDRLVLLSASPDLYVPSIASALGFDECVCTELRWRDGRLDGGLVTKNRRGEEKQRVVRGLLDRLDPPCSAAYGNAASDLSHLVLVTRPLLVNANRRARALAAMRGVPTADWP
jgi:HAD superfamily hydrolase (TIGR01490 family)